MLLSLTIFAVVFRDAVAIRIDSDDHPKHGETLQPTLQESVAPVKPVVFDIGMNSGDGTRAYLTAGFKVVAVEANPYWVQRNTALFANELADGSLTIVNAAISKHNGSDIPFYVPRVKQLGGFISFASRALDKLGICPPAWSSKIQNESFGGCTGLLEHAGELASISNATCKYCGPYSPVCECDEVAVTGITCKSLVETYGRPYYIKTESDGFDGVCMRDLFDLPCNSLPQHISFEEQSTTPLKVRGFGGTSEELMANLSSRGYRWKVARQGIRHRSGEFGEDSTDFIHGKLWSAGSDAKQRATTDCWMNGALIEQYNCDVHGRFEEVHCKKPGTPEPAEQKPTESSSTEVESTSERSVSPLPTAEAHTAADPSASHGNVLSLQERIHLYSGIADSGGSAK